MISKFENLNNKVKFKNTHKKRNLNLYSKLIKGKNDPPGNHKQIERRGEEWIYSIMWNNCCSV